MKRKLKILLLIIFILITAFSFYVMIKEDRKGFLTVAFLDVGQGDAIFIDSPNGNQILIDGGRDRGILRELSKVMNFYDRKIDVIIATHPDTDHTSGLNDVLVNYDTDVFIEPGVESDAPAYKELKKRVNNLQIRTIEARGGMVIDIGGGASLEILYPVLDPSGMETNTASIVARLVYGESEFMLTGDSPANIEEYLLSIQKCDQKQKDCNDEVRFKNLRSDVLKAGHHGSNTSTSQVFVEAVSPKYAVISAGKDNRYGHPHKEVLDILNKNGVRVLNTAEQGRIIFKTNGTNLEIKK